MLLIQRVKFKAGKVPFMLNNVALPVFCVNVAFKSQV